MTLIRFRYPTKQLIGIICMFLLCVQWPLLADEPKEGNVLITEIMANPVGLTAFPETEYVEIYNTSDSVIHIQDWSFIYGSNVVLLPEFTLPAETYALLYRAGREIFVEEGGLAIPVASFPVNLANNGKRLQLENSLGDRMDSVTYKAAKPARSWERDTTGVWYLSHDARGGTPGATNSQKEKPIELIDTSQPGDVLITEIMANPPGLTDLPETEYVEIYNASDSVISLNGWSFMYDGKPTALPDTLLPVQSYVILFRSGRDILVDDGGIALPIDAFPSNLANNGKQVQLVNSKGFIIDSVSYMAAKPARSWESDLEGTWYLSNDPRGGTPGSVNSQKEVEPPVKPNPDNSQPGDVLITEIMANPVGLTAFPETEYIEIYNASDSVLYLKNWTLVYDGRAVSFSDTFLLPHRYALLFRSGRTVFVDEGGVKLPMPAFPSSLANNGKSLELINSKGITIDLAAYAAARKARSWERDSEGGWYLSNDVRGGTPGSVNSQKIVEPPVEPNTDNSQPGDVLITEIMANPVGLTAFPETEYVEIQNASDSAIRLKDWSFVYGTVSIPIPDITLPIGSYALLYRSGRFVFVDEGGLAVPVISFPSNLTNAGKHLQLKNSLNYLIDSVTYQSAKPARSWERDATGTWYLTNDIRGGTPGSKNSQKVVEPPEVVNPDRSQPGDVLITEIMANPVGLTVLPETEYLEIYNTTDSAIRLKNWAFIYGTASIPLPDLMLPVGRYAVLYRSGRSIFIDKGGVELPVASFPSNLTNTGKHLQLRNSLGHLIDSATYQPPKPAQSWERDSVSVWYLSNDERGGTPGSKNSPKVVEPPEKVNPDQSQPGDVLITEVMANPQGLTAFPETEYIEIYNASDSVLHLKGWALVYDGKYSFLPDTFLPVHKYAVLFRSGREIHIDDGGMAMHVATFPANLANTGKSLQIRNSKDTIIDSLTYASAKPARSWEYDSTGWYLSTDMRGGTPGSPNSSRKPTDTIPSIDFSVEPDELILNELLPEPRLGGSEYIELYNRSERMLYLSGLSIATRRTDGTIGTRYAFSALSDSIQPQGYVVITSDRNAVLDFYYTSDADVIYEVKLPQLNNTGATLVLLRTKDDQVIDEVSYSSKWHDGAIRDVKGVALERISSEEETQESKNWASALSEVGYGTPGYKNSQSGMVEQAEAVRVEAPTYDERLGAYLIHYETDRTGYRCRMHVYTPEGKRVAEICNNQLIGLNGEIHWQARGADGNNLHAGLYVFYAEFYHPEGQTKSYKKVFLIRP